MCLVGSLCVCLPGVSVFVPLRGCLFVSLSRGLFVWLMRCFVDSLCSCVRVCERVCVAGWLFACVVCVVMWLFA